MTKSKLEAAKKMARDHFRVDDQVKRIHLIDSPKDQDPDEPIRLLEVVEGTLECGVQPIAFAPDPDHGTEYPSEIIEVSPREYEAIQDGSLPLAPWGWTIGEELSA